jgi:hypothetical protein
MIKVPPGWGYDAEGACALNIYINITEPSNQTNKCWLWVDNTLRVVERFKLQKTYNRVRRSHCSERKKKKGKKESSNEEETLDDLTQEAQEIFRNAISNKRARDETGGVVMSEEKPAKQKREADGSSRDKDSNKELQGAGKAGDKHGKQESTAQSN